MALSGNFSTNKYATQNYGTIGLNLSWTATQSVADNTTTINWVLASNGSMTTGYSVYGGPITVVINGVTVLSITSRIRVYGGGAFRRTGSITVNHNVDGTKDVAMSVKAALYAGQVNCSASKSYSLDKIDRFAIITSAASFDDENYPTIEYSNPRGTEYVTGLKVRITWADGSRATNWVNLNDEGGSYTFNADTFTDEEKAEILAAHSTTKQAQIRFDLSSVMDGEEYHFYSDGTMYIVNDEPIAGPITYYDSNSEVVAKTGNNQVLVQNNSTVVISSGVATPKKGASIVSYNLNINGSDYDITEDRTKTFIAPNLAGVFPATVTVTDSRGNTTQAVLDITIYELVAPTAVFALGRIDNFYTETLLNVKTSYSPVGGTNSIQITEKHRTIGGTWSGAAAVEDGIDKILMLDNTQEWEIEISISDEYSETIYAATIGKGTPLFFFDKKRNSVAFNGLPDEDYQCYIGGDMELIGSLNGVDMAYIDTEVLSECVTKKSGSFTISKARFKKWGDVCQLYIAVKTSASIAAGANLDMNFGSVLAYFIPDHSVYTCEYDAQRLIGAMISPADNIVRIRNSNTSVGSGVTIEECFTWIL